jgi:TolA-binding protein
MSGRETPEGSTKEQRDKMIAEAAYFRAQQRGFRGGDPAVDWLEAEREVDEKLATSAPGEEKPSSVAALVQQLEARIRSLDEDIAPLKERAREVGADVRQEIEKELERLKPLRAAAEQRLVELRGRSEVALEEVKKGADRAWEEISTAVKGITNRIKASSAAGRKQRTKAQSNAGEQPGGGPE